MFRQPSSTPGLALLFVVPLLILAAVAVAGLRAREAAAMERAREQARATLSLRAEALVRDLTDRKASLRFYPSPPRPGPAAAADDPLESGDSSKLLEIMEDRAAGLSPAGLPRQVLAALRLREIGGKIPPQRLLDLVTRDAPSILTPVVLESLRQEIPAGAGAALAAWEQEEIARRFARRADKDGWHETAEGWWWFKREASEWLCLSPEDFQESMHEAARTLSPGLAARLRAGERRLGGHEGGEVLATANLEIAGGWVFEIIATDPAAVLADTRREQAWSMALITLAMIVPAVAAFFLLRNLGRERQLAELKSQFVASVSHELRAPVGSIRLMAEALHQGTVGGSTAQEFHSLIASEGARLSHLVENVLDIARIEDGRKRYRFEECDLARLVTDAVKIIEPLAAERGIRIDAAIAETSATVDPHAIQQAVVNLLDNAVKFSPAGSTVNVVLDSPGLDEWNIAIRDEGPGIPEAEHQRIFDRFHRLGNELRRETQGTGIGLSIVQHVATAHGGRIRLDSQQGRGSTFTLTAPIRHRATS